jgi:hypothetical protein
MRLSSAIPSPVEFESEKVKLRTRRPLSTTEPNDPSLVSGERQAELLKPRLKRLEEGFCCVKSIEVCISLFEAVSSLRGVRSPLRSA